MNHRAVLRSLGIVLLAEAGCMIPSLIIALYYKEGDTSAFALTMAILVIAGLALVQFRPVKKGLYARDGLAIVSLGWIGLSLFGAMPFYFSGEIPVIVDAIFESVSGFTTTGASILTDVERLSKGLLFWRSFTHWIGGMGVLLLTLAILPLAGAGAVHILRAESPGPSPGKLVPKLAQTAKILYILYLGLTVAEVIALLIAGMPFFDALIHAFGTAGTGGFSNRNSSVGAYNSLTIDIIIGVFMLLFGISFALHYQLIRGNWRSVLKDEELRFYLLVVAASVLLITWDVGRHQIMGWGETLRHSFFQVSSIITTTGFTTHNFDDWPTLSKSILVVLMLIGASAGSTGGGIKCIRILMVLKMIRRELVRMKHPQVVQGIRIGKRLVDQQVLMGSTLFVLFYLIIMTVAIFIVSIEARDMVTSFTAVVACLSNIGPGLGLVGPTGHYADFSQFVKVVLSICMLIGRLEIMPVVLLALPSFWRRVSI
ncbi:MAG: TrkH family potassium uptake protein [Clostridiaceae bacterium]|nr:TrkH family potassium uptake protein [Clostridiaceae bacterium]